MKLTVAVKLLPSSEQADALRETMRRSNAASDHVSEIAWDAKVFGKHSLQRLTYRSVKDRFSLTAQAAIQAIRKVADSYRLDNKTQRTYRKFGSIAYDDRILSWKPEASEVSIWTVAEKHRQRMPFVCGVGARKMLKTRRGETDLVYRGGKFYLLATVEVEEPPLGTPEDWLGVDLGIVSLATDSDGETHSGEGVDKARKRYERIRGKLQAAGTKSAKRHLKKLAKRERRMKRDVNHVISKRLVSKAVLVRTVYLRNTSRESSECGHCEKANRKSRDDFLCRRSQCGHTGPADVNAAVNIGRADFMRPIVAEIGIAAHASSVPPAAIPRALAVGS